MAGYLPLLTALAEEMNLMNIYLKKETASKVQVPLL